MTISWNTMIAATLTLVLTVLAPAQEQERKINRSDLPPAVEKAVVEQSRGSTIRGFSEEKVHGQHFYEAELVVNGHSKDVLIDVHGAVVEVEEQIELAAVPPAVREGLQARANKGKIVKVETLTKKGNLVAYEAEIVKNGRKTEVQVSPGGKPLDHEE